MADIKRPISLKEFADNMPPGILHDPSMGRYVFGSRVEDTLPYLVEPGAEAAVRPEEVLKIPVTQIASVFNFDLSKEAHLKQYQVLVNAIASGWYRTVFVERHWDDNTKNMHVYIEVLNRHRVIKPQSEYDSIYEMMKTNTKPRPIM